MFLRPTTLVVPIFLFLCSSMTVRAMQQQNFNQIRIESIIKALSENNHEIMQRINASNDEIMKAREVMAVQRWQNILELYRSCNYIELVPFHPSPEELARAKEICQAPGRKKFGKLHSELLNEVFIRLMPNNNPSCRQKVHRHYYTDPYTGRPINIQR